MNENAMGKEVVDAAVKVHRELGFLLNFGASLMKDGIERIVHGLEEENLGVFASLREPCLRSAPPNGGSATPSGNSSVTEGLPSVN